MSTAVAECTDLEELLGEDPPCGIRTYESGYRTPCGAPSVVRVRFSCTCGDASTRFVCAPHYRDVLHNYIRCRSCGVMLDEGLTWKVI